MKYIEFRNILVEIASNLIEFSVELNFIVKNMTISGNGVSKLRRFFPQVKLFFNRFINFFL